MPHRNQDIAVGFALDTRGLVATPTFGPRLARWANGIAIGFGLRPGWARRVAIGFGLELRWRRGIGFDFGFRFGFRFGFCFGLDPRRPRDLNAWRRYTGIRLASTFATSPFATTTATIAAATFGA